MVDILASNGRDALISVANVVHRYGQRSSPRGQPTLEVRHLSVQITDPRDTLCLGIGANQSREVVASEAIQLIGAFSDAEFAVKHAPLLRHFVNDHNFFDGAYGPRAYPLLPHVERRLRADPDTRQAVLPIWDATDVLRETSRDYPCTLSLGFFIRDEKLELDVVMRSNDVNWGFKNDIFQFTQLQLSLATVLGREPGPYRHTAMSMHLYEKDLDWVKGLSRKSHDRAVPIEGHPTGVGVPGETTSVEVLVDRARRIALSPETVICTPSEKWYREALDGTDS